MSELPLSPKKPAGGAGAGMSLGQYSQSAVAARGGGGGGGGGGGSGGGTLLPPIGNSGARFGRGLPVAKGGETRSEFLGEKESVSASPLGAASAKI